MKRVFLSVILLVGVMPVSGIASVGTVPIEPTRSAAVRLGGGDIGRFLWSAVAFRSRGHGSDKRPCLELKLHPKHPELLEIPIGDLSCRPVHPRPNFFGVVDEIDKPRVTMYAMAFPSSVHSVSLYFAGKLGDRTIPLKLLSSAQAEKTGLARFAYANLAFRGRSCLSRYVARSATGRIVEDGGRMRCRNWAAPGTN